MLEEHPKPDGGSHAHRDCRSRERVWLAKQHVATATAALHPFCVECGTVRNLTWPRARPIGYFLGGIGALKEYLDHDSLRPRLAQVQSHLIASRLAVRLEFEDPYGTPGQVQLDTYVDVVRSIRSDLDEELILRLLPGPRGRRRKEALS